MASYQEMTVFIKSIEKGKRWRGADECNVSVDTTSHGDKGEGGMGALSPTLLPCPSQ